MDFWYVNLHKIEVRMIPYSKFWQFVLFIYFWVRLFVCLFVCLFLVCIWRQNRGFLNRYWCIQTLIKKIQKKLWTEIFDMLNYITFWFERYQIHIFNNLFFCFSLFAIVCLFICLFIYEAYLTSKTPFLTDTLAFKHRLRNHLKIYEYEFLIC